jgi:hypothetical protein
VPSMTFTCDSLINGMSRIFTLKMWVWDLNGNRDYCEVTLNVQDNKNVCPDIITAGTVVIDGKVTTYDGGPVASTFVQVISTHPEYPKFGISDTTGSYRVINNPKGYDYIISPDRATPYDEGVTTLDLVLIQRHILGLSKFNNPHHIIAADATDDERVSSVDLVAIRKVILGISETFPNKSWRFVHRGHTLDPQSPFPVVDRKILFNLQSDAIQNDMIAIKIGDVNNSIRTVLDGLTVASPRTSTTWTGVLRSEGGAMYIDVVADQDQMIHGFQTTFRGGQIEEIIPRKLGIDRAFIHQVNPWHARMSYHTEAPVEVFRGQILFTLRMPMGVDPRSVSFTDKELMSEAYLGESLEVSRLGLHIDERSISSTDERYSLDQNVPNPFIDKTMVAFSIPRDATVTFEITDDAGRVVQTTTQEYTSGRHEIFLRGASFVPGVYFYSIKVDGRTITRSMLAVK